MIPSFFNLLLTEIIYQINIMNIGKLGDENKLAGCGLAASLISSLPLSLTYGTSSVLETLVSQAHGSKQYELCINYLSK